MNYPVIKYRGLPSKGDSDYRQREFVYGSLLTGLWINHGIPIYEIVLNPDAPVSLKARNISTMNGFTSVRVLPSTVARMICKLDSGKELYENDIVGFLDYGNYGSHVTAQVISEEGRVYLKSGVVRYNLSEILAGKEENLLCVEGNIIQHPYLLSNQKL